MRAVTIPRFGDADILTLTDVPTPKGVLGFNLAAFSATHPARAGQALRRAVDAVLAGRIEIDVRDQLSLTDAANAHRRIESGRSTGKLVLSVSPLPQASVTHLKGLSECAR